MVISLEIAGQLIVITMFVCGCFKYVVITPLQRAIESLGQGIDCLNRSLEKVQEQQHVFDKKLGIVEEQIKVVNHRIEDLEDTTQACKTAKCCVKEGT